MHIITKSLLALVESFSKPILLILWLTPIWYMLIVLIIIIKESKR